jgi:hypothetical protein
MIAFLRVKDHAADRFRSAALFWLGRKDSNLRMTDPKSVALPTWPLPKRGRIVTCPSSSDKGF